MNTNVRARSCAHLFPPSKWAGLFPSAAYRRSAPPQLVQGRLKWRCLGCFGVVWMALQRRKTGLFFLHGWRCIYSAHASWDVSTWIWIFLQHKRPAWFHIHAGLYCEPEVLSPDGGLSYPTSTELHQTREPWHLSCHGGNSAAKQLSFQWPRALWARSGVQGHCPCLEEDADHAAVAFVDDLAEGLLYFLLGVYGHPHQLVGKALPHQLVQALAEEVRVPDGLGVVLELLQ